MIASPAAQKYPASRFETKFLSPNEFFDEEKLVKRHDDIVWKIFRTHGKFMKKVKSASWFAVAVNEKGDYVSSAFIIDGHEVWIIENVMTDPEQQSKGAGSAVMAQIMREAKKRNVQWVILHCDPAKNDGQLPKFYSKFGFRVYPELARPAPAGVEG